MKTGKEEYRLHPKDCYHARGLMSSTTVSVRDMEPNDVVKITWVFGVHFIV
jgi:hypothetical protein